jgi:hypothetical protein
MKPPEPMDEDHGGGQVPYRVVAPLKKIGYVVNNELERMWK